MTVVKYPHYTDLKNRTVLITGGGSGIGASFVEAFVGQGSHVAFLDIQEDASSKLVSKQSLVGTAPLFVKCDLTDIRALKKAVADVEKKLGPVRVLVNNAANDERHEPEDVTPEYWEQRLRLNLSHHFFAAQAVQPAMAKAGGGSIINITSISSFLGSQGNPAYHASKGGLKYLTKSLAADYGKFNIRCNQSYVRLIV